MSRSRRFTLAGLVLAVLAALLAEVEGPGLSEAPGAAAAAEPLAAALVPLGPAKAVVSTLLWSQLLRHRQENDPEITAAASRALLALHPGLESVREHLAWQLLVTDVSLAGDPERQRALVLTGLTLLEEGLELEDSPRLHGTLGQVLALRLVHEPRLRQVAEEYFGAPPEEIAIQELREADNPALAPLLAELLLQRGGQAWEREQDDYAARRDLSEARRLLDDLDEQRVDPVHRRELSEALAALDALLPGDERPGDGRPEDGP